MKKLLSIILISIFLISLCIIEEVLVKDTLLTINKMGNEIYNISVQKQAINTDEILQMSQDLQKFWEKKEDLLCFFVNHKDMHEMGNEILKMISYSKNNIKEEFLTSLELVIYYSSTFRHLMGVSIQNIF